MSISIQPPRPGDLITSNFVKQLIDQLIALDKRITELEEVVPGANGKVAIFQITPSDAAIGEQLQIVGVNFGLPAENIVSFDGGNAQVPTSGNDKRLFITVPAMSLEGAESKTVVVGVSNRRGFDSWPITLHAIAPTIPGGSITVVPGQIPSITPGADWVIPFTIQARTNMDESYDLVPSVPTVSAGTPWTARMVTDQGGVTELPKPYRMFIPKPPPGQVATTVSAFLKVSIPAGTNVTSPFVKLDVNSVRNPPPNPNALAGTSGQVAFQFGQPQQPQTVGFAIATITGATGDKSMVTMAIPTPTAAPLNGISYVLQGLKQGRYTATLKWQDTASNNRGWTASFGGLPGQADWPRTTLTIDMSVAGDFGPQKVSIIGAPGATQNTLLITVRSGENPTTDYGILPQGVKPAGQS